MCNGEMIKMKICATPYKQIEGYRQLQMTQITEEWISCIQSATSRLPNALFHYE